ncbi:hypothetical protein BWQ96_10422 [Gracilariopsis chorda]|uniref:Uncharacterized protein n=1 Tax=Gracilariopsis chorda TaxID=448386 RepID=A0A2V3ICR3_9FLOR|nr:hypothetical protein BWQ96_10422 [Gracilariopsis chorda]|eukprot:PXF39867.1 hypothetical protein BWQ96_10422 [Gracilariopsis chorda]
MAEAKWEMNAGIDWIKGDRSGVSFELTQAIDGDELYIFPPS